MGLMDADTSCIPVIVTRKILKMNLPQFYLNQFSSQLGNCNDLKIDKII
jgi:hypothetical protein